MRPFRFPFVLSALLLVVPHEVAAATLIARGNEPGWQATISETAITFRTLDTAEIAIKPAPNPTRARHGDTYAAKVDGTSFSLTISGKGCVDTMSGMPFPKTATVAFGARVFRGCAGESADLLRGDWKVAAIGAAHVKKGSRPTLVFDAEGRVSGNGSCNRYFGGFKLTGEGLTISEIGTSMMMCDPPLMDQERNLFKALEQVRRFEVGKAGKLRLVDEKGRPVVSLRR